MASSGTQGDGASGADGSVPTTQAELQAALEALKADTSLTAPPIPSIPILPVNMPMRRRLHALQRYISSFEYNHTGKLYFNVRRDAGLQKLMIQAKAIQRMALPIQCMEALFLATYLTAEYKDVLRLPLSFKSRVEGHTFRHIVLAVEHKGKWGALGMSRKRTLMHKDLVYPSLSALVAEYKRRYEEIWHELVKVYVGFPFSHDTFCQARLQWRVLRLRVDMNEWEEVAAVLDKYAKVADALFDTYQYTGTVPVSVSTDFRLFSPGDDSDPEYTGVGVVAGKGGDGSGKAWGAKGPSSPGGLGRTSTGHGRRPGRSSSSRKGLRPHTAASSKSPSPSSSPRGRPSTTTSTSPRGRPSTTTTPKRGRPGKTTTSPKRGRPGTTTSPKRGRPGTTTSPKRGRPGTTTSPKRGRPGTTIASKRSSAAAPAPAAAEPVKARLTVALIDTGAETRLPPKSPLRTAEDPAAAPPATPAAAPPATPAATSAEDTVVAALIGAASGPQVASPTPAEVAKKRVFLGV